MFTSPVGIESGMLVMCCMLYAMSVSMVCYRVSWWNVCVFYCDMFSLAYVYVDQL